MDDFLRTLLMITKRLEDAGFDYMVTGSVALMFYGTPRMTRDVDIVVALEAADVDRFVVLFADAGYLSDEAVRDAVRRRSMFNLIFHETMIKVDFVVRKDSEFRRAELSRRQRLSVAGETGEAWVVSVEDLVLSKLVWAKDSRSEQQQRDIENLVRGRDLDRAWLDRWSGDLGVGDLYASWVKP